MNTGLAKEVGLRGFLLYAVFFKNCANCIIVNNFIARIPGVEYFLGVGIHLNVKEGLAVDGGGRVNFNT